MLKREVEFVSQNYDFEIFMVASHAVKKEIDGPTAGDAAESRIAGHHFLEMRARFFDVQYQVLMV